MTYDIVKAGFEAKAPEVIDSSMLSDFVACPSKFYLRHVLGLKPKMDLGNPNLLWGTKWHDLMYAWHHHYDMEEAVAALDPWPEAVLNAEEKKARTKDRMILCFSNYIKKWHSVDQKQVEVIRREQYFDIECERSDSCPLGGCGLRWCGRLDKLAKVQKRIGPIDYKTTGAMGMTYWDRYKHGFQIPGYTWAAVHITNEPVKSGWLDVLYVTKTKMDLFRREFMYNMLYLTEWKDNVVRITDRIWENLDKYLHDPEAWERNQQWCANYGLCEYAQIHFSPNYQGRNRYDTLKQDYKVDRWDPSDMGE